jgi:hypothetical protein
MPGTVCRSREEYPRWLPSWLPIKLGVPAESGVCAAGLPARQLVSAGQGPLGRIVTVATTATRPTSASAGAVLPVLQDHLLDECVRGLVLYGGKGSPLTPAGRGCLSARSLAYIGHLAYTWKGGLKGFQPGPCSRYMQTKPPSGVTGDTGSLLDAMRTSAALYRAPGRRDASAART